MVLLLLMLILDVESRLLISECIQSVETLLNEIPNICVAAFSVEAHHRIRLQTREAVRCLFLPSAQETQLDAQIRSFITAIAAGVDNVGSSSRDSGHMDVDSEDPGPAGNASSAAASDDTAKRTALIAFQQQVKDWQSRAHAYVVAKVCTDLSTLYIGTHPLLALTF